MEEGHNYESERKASYFGMRHLECLMVFFGLAVAYSHRVNFSVAIVAMTDRNATNPDFEEYEWSEQTRSHLLSGFLWGYFITQIPGGQLARKYGGKIMFLVSLSVSGILSLLTPFCARIGDWKLVFALRMAQGIMQGCIFPSTHTIISKWAPPEERGSIGTFCYSGPLFGISAILAVSGVIASSSMGWPGIFYISGFISLLWCLVWYFVGASSPSKFKWISAEERMYIEKSLLTSSKHEEEQTPTKVPWIKILTSVPFLAIVVAQCTYAWGFWTLITQIPNYMKNILEQDIKSNALLSALPYLANMLMTIAFCALNDVLIKRKYLSVRVSRKMFNTIGFWIPMVSIILLSYVSADQSQVAVMLLVITVGVNSASSLGYLPTLIDISPNFAGILMGIANCIANLASILAPLLVGVVVTDTKNVNQWRIIFYVTAALYFIGNLLFLIFGQTSIQKWNNLQEDQQRRDHIKFERVKEEEAFN